MQIGVVFPQTEIGADPLAIRDYAQAAEELGYKHLLAYDHVLGANAASRPGWSGAYRHSNMFHEPFVLFGYLAALTRKLELVTGILILPQRQTALVAKQSAALDVLSGGRLRLGIGIGWNAVEYEALGEDFHNRGRRSEEQVQLMRALWTNELVTFEGRWHRVTDAGLNPLPVQRPIPIWFGGGGQRATQSDKADRVLKRIARLADGWFPQAAPGDEFKATLERLRRYADDAGRGPDEIGIEAQISIRSGGPADWAQSLEAWKDLGATHVSVNTMNAGLSSPDGHIEALRRFTDTTAL